MVISNLREEPPKAETKPSNLVLQFEGINEIPRGHFSIANVPPGQYKAFASLADLQTFGMFRNSSYLKGVEELGLPVSVGAGEKRTVQLKPIPR